MNRSYGALLVSMLCLCSGCGKSTEATSTPQLVPPLTQPVIPPGIPAGGMVFEKEPPIHMPQLTRDLLDQIQVEVIETQSSAAVRGDASLSARGSLVGIKVRVKNNLGNVRIDVGAHRFTVLDEKGNTLPLTVSSEHSPSLGKMYLGPNETVEGWLCYRAPGDAGRLVLKSDLRNPAIQIPLDVLP